MESTSDDEEFYTDSDESIDQATENVVPSFSFSGCGFLGVYHIGVASCLRDHTDVVSRKEIKFAGASAGALVATTLLCDIDFGEMTRMFLEIAKVVRDKEHVDLAQLLRNVMDHYLPEDAHLRLRNRLYISMTILKGLQCGLVTDFQSKEHLIECLIASSYVPGFIGWIPPGMDGDCFVDVNNKPLSDYASRKKKQRPATSAYTSTSSTSTTTTSSQHSSLPSSCRTTNKLDSDGLSDTITPASEQSLTQITEPFLSSSSTGDCLLVSEDEDTATSSYSSEESDDVSYDVGEEFFSDEAPDGDVGSSVKCPSKGKEMTAQKECTATSVSRHSRNTKKSYLSRLVWLCFSGIQKTSSVMRNSRIIQSVSPKILGDFEGLLEALLLEMLSNKYTVLDGGFSDNIPIFDKNTITVCPFAGESDICPRDMTAIDFSIELGRTSFHYSDDNVYRLNHALKPMEPDMLLSLCEEGYNECLRYLHKKDLLSCRQHLMTRATISPSPCNIGHAHCRCGLCLEVDQKIRRSLSCMDCQMVKQRALKSILPSDVRNEFHKAIEDFRASKREPQVATFWGRVVDLLWWWAEKMYSQTMAMADLVIQFHNWLLRFCDNMVCFAKFTVLPLGQKRRLVRYLLSTLTAFIGATAKKSLSSVPAFPATIMR